jgi:hypothetical protein
MRFLKNFREQGWTTTHMDKSLRGKHLDQGGLQDHLANIGNPTMKISLLKIFVKGMMKMHIHPLSLELTS